MPYKTGGQSVYQRLMPGYDLPGHDYSVNQYVLYMCESAFEYDARRMLQNNERK